MGRATGTGRWVVRSALCVVTACAAYACGSETGSGFPEGPQGTSGGPGSSGALGSSGTSGEVKSPYASIEIAPLDSVLTVDLNASSPTANFTATGVYPDGRRAPIVNGVWNYSRIDAAAFPDNKPTLVPTGFVGGRGEVKFTYLNQSATTSATVKLRMVTGTPPAGNVEAAFQSATADDGAMQLLYPYDLTVFPRGLPTPRVQWDGGGAGDLYKIRAESSTFDYTAYATLPPPSRFEFPSAPADVWAKLTDSTVGAVKVSVQRWTGAIAFKAKTRTWTIAQANLKGTIYYTRLKAGDSFVRRIEPGKTAEPFLQKTAGVNCIACHSVSRDGSRIVASVNGGRSPWAVYDARTGNELFRSNESSGFQAISPDGSHVLWRHWNADDPFRSEGELRLSRWQNTPGDAVIATLSPSPTTLNPTHPVWSPDGKKIAFSMRPKADNGLNVKASSLWTSEIDLAATPPAFANARKIVDPTAALGVVTYPSFTPDSNWLGFMRANQSRSDGSDPKGELWLGSLDGATLIRLDRANGVPDVSANDKSWGPSFHPVASGGYFWLAFFTRRPYGNTFNGANPQVWLTAVDANPKAGQDPSHPAFYITGQDDDSINERPQFAVKPCEPLGSSCVNGYDCCDGYCRADASGKLVCQQKTNVCSQESDKCVTTADCCAGLSCIGGFCTSPGPR